MNSLASNRTTTPRFSLSVVCVAVAAAGCASVLVATKAPVQSVNAFPTAVGSSANPPASTAGPPVNLNPAGWGSNHVGRPLPEYVTGDECLFCHRIKIGPAWPNNRHQSTIRRIDLEPTTLDLLKASVPHEPFAKQVEFVLGRTNQMRFLKRSAAYGKLDLLSTRLPPASRGAGNRLAEERDPHWEKDAFANRCAGCHATGVDSRTQSFSAISLDCFACHGDVDIDHTKDTTKILLAKKRGDPARVVTSICASCHVRSGRSRSTGRPFPNGFVPGDNLFLDFEVDFSGAALDKLPPADRHVLRNVRDVALHGNEQTTCLSCHTVHRMSADRHQKQRRAEICWDCHERNSDNLRRDWSQVHSMTCGY